MKKLFHIATSAVVGAACFGNFASAATCEGLITLTGPSSNNTVSCTEINNINVTCNNNLWVGTVNNQTGTSGSGDVVGNTAGGSVVTGTVVNENGQNVTIGTDCGNGGGGGGGGTSVSTPTTPGAGAASAPLPSVLPYTANDSPLSVIMTGIIAAAGAFVITRLGVVAYRAIKLR